MEFWLLFFGSIWFIYISSIMVKSSQQRYIAYIYFLFIWFIGAFRKDIGTDYSAYENMYNIWPIHVHNSYFFDADIEPTFSFIVACLQEFDFHSQMLFVVYETIILMFLYLSVRKYFHQSFCILAFILLYVAFPTNGGYWWGLNVMRQAAAISISFYASSFLDEKKLAKSIMIFALACMFHYSAIIVVLLFLFPKKISVYVVFILLILGFLFNFTGINAQIIMQCASLISSLLGKYEYSSFIAVWGTASFSVTAAYFSFLYIVSIYYITPKAISPLMMNGSSIYILLRVYMSFGVEDSVLSTVVHRFETYFLPFFLLLLVQAIFKCITELTCRWKAIVVTSIVYVSFIVIAIHTLNAQHTELITNINGGASVGNVIYKMSFDLF